MSYVHTTFHFDAGDLTVKQTQDVEPVLERNKKLQNEPQNRKSDFRHIASIPNIFLIRWLDEEYARGNTTIKFLSEEMDALVEKKLNDPDWKWLRTDK